MKLEVSLVGIWFFQVAILLLCLTASAFLVGEYMAKVFSGKKTMFSPLLVPVETLIYRIFRIDPLQEMNWKEFLANFLLTSCWGFISLVLIQRLQHLLPLNPCQAIAIDWSQAVQRAISFVTNTNWQCYEGDAPPSYFTRLVGLGVQNFLAPALAMSVAMAVINGLLRRNGEGLGNFWVYLTRSVLYILLPLAMVLALFLMLQGSPNNLHAAVKVKTLEGTEQLIAQGPVAAQVAIRQLGTGGGGFFKANAAHPYENPTPLTDLVNILALLLLAAAFPFVFGVLSKDRKEGWFIFIAMLLLFIGSLVIASWTELGGAPLFEQLHIGPGVSMEGKEVRFGNIATATSATAATATAGGAANSVFAGLMPLTTMVLAINMSLGEVIFGGVGTGFINLIFYLILTMFLVALMIGRTPEIYGKKLGEREIVLASLVLFMPAALQLILTSLAIYLDSGWVPTEKNGHKLLELFYGYTSAIMNNGSTLASSKGSLFYQLSSVVTMLIGYLLPHVSALGLAGIMVRKNASPRLARFPTANVLVGMLLIGTVLLSSTLSFFPIFMLGPIVEHLKIMGGSFFIG